jgi:hypothetical protein
MRLAVASVVVALTAVTCTTGPERALLDQFFTASRLRDRTALARFATVVFEPRRDGIVAEFVVLGKTPERDVDEHISAEGPAGVAADRQRVISLSLADPIDPVDWTRYPAVLEEKDVTASARIGNPDGSEVTRPVVVTMQRARVESDRRRLGRWIVVRFVY